LWVREQEVVVCVERIDSRHQLRTYTRLGTVSDPLDLAAGRCLVAFLPAAEQHDLLSVLAARRNPPLPIDALQARLDRIAADGYDETDRSVAANGCGLSAPIKAAAGRVVAAVTVSGPLERFDSERRPQLVTELLEAAERISADLGHRSPATAPADRSPLEGVRL
jgi:IclR family transcriptional regulator, KDG regulon repressor